MELTEERVMPKLMNPKNGLLIEHIARYKFASKLSEGRIADLACGSGYGTEILIKGPNKNEIQEIVAIDSDKASLNYAKKHYSNKKLKQAHGFAEDTDLYVQLGLFDTIVSMETIEHIEDDYGFVKNLITLLKPGGTAIISTPFGRGRDFECRNPFHYRQYTENEFRHLLSPFKNVEMFHQIGNVIEKPIEGKKYYLMIAVCRI